MTMLDERLRRVGEELDRAARAYEARSSERTYVAPVHPPRSHKQHVVVAVAAMFVLLVGVALATQAARQDDRKTSEPPNGRAIAQNLGDTWLWPDAEADVPAGTPDEITREFATRVLGLTDFTVAPAEPGPTGMRIDTPTMSLSLTTMRVPGPTERWVVYELNSTELSLDESTLVVNSPQGTTSFDLFVRFVSDRRAERLDLPHRGGGPIGFPFSDEFVSALVVFRNDRGEVIDAASLDVDSITPQSLVSCTFELNDERATASLKAAVGETASATIGAYSARAEIVEDVAGRAMTRVDAGYPSLRVELSGPLPPGSTPNPDLPPGVIYRAESGLRRIGPDALGGGSSGVTFTCSVANPVRAPSVPTSR